MLSELRVKDLGVIQDSTLSFGPGLTAVTGETGAGKTLVVGAIDLLMGARAGSEMVRAGATEARVDGRFLFGSDGESVLSRVVPAEGRSRAYVDGSPATAASLAEAATGLVDLHGQHDHQALLGTAQQRAALDEFGAIDTEKVTQAAPRVATVRSAIAELGGDAQTRLRELEVLQHQATEIAEAGLTADDEESGLIAEVALLSDAASLREAVEAAREALTVDGGASDRLGVAATALSGKTPLQDLAARAAQVAADADELAHDLLVRLEVLTEDPARLEDVLARQRLLRDLRRKYGETLADVRRFGEEASARAELLASAEERGGQLEEELAVAEQTLQIELDALREARLAASTPLAVAVQTALRRLALPKAEMRIEVSGAGGGEVEFVISTNPGEPLQPLRKVASGGELSRTMLALRLVLAGLDAEVGPSTRKAESVRTVIFDEVDAGIGGQAAVEIGRALAAVARTHQVLVVTHLPQVAAFADHQLAVRKIETDGRAVTTIEPVTGADRVVELSRMLSGQPESESARDHAAELLEAAAADRALS